MMNLSKLFTMCLILFTSFAFAQKDFRAVDQLIEKNSSMLNFFTQNHSKEELKDFSDKFNSANDQEKEIMLKSFLGNDYSAFEKSALEYNTLDGRLDRKAYEEGELQEYISNYNHDYTNLSSLTGKRNVKAYNHCCDMVVGAAVVMGTGCSALTAGIGTVICVAGALAYESFGIANCADNWL